MRSLDSKWVPVYTSIVPNIASLLISLLADEAHYVDTKTTGRFFLVGGLAATWITRLDQVQIYGFNSIVYDTVMFQQDLVLVYM